MGSASFCQPLVRCMCRLDYSIIHVEYTSNVTIAFFRVASFFFSSYFSFSFSSLILNFTIKSFTVPMIPTINSAHVFAYMQNEHLPQCTTISNAPAFRHCTHIFGAYSERHIETRSNRLLGGGRGRRTAMLYRHYYCSSISFLSSAVK